MSFLFYSKDVSRLVTLTSGNDTQVFSECLLNRDEARFVQP